MISNGSNRILNKVKSYWIYSCTPKVKRDVYSSNLSSTGKKLHQHTNTDTLIIYIILSLKNKLYNFGTGKINRSSQSAPKSAQFLFYATLM
jgi:hypothetical protein